MNGLNIHIYGFIFLVSYKYMKLFVLTNYNKIIHKGQIG